MWLETSPPSIALFLFKASDTWTSPTLDLITLMPKGSSSFSRIVEQGTLTTTFFSLSVCICLARVISIYLPWFIDDYWPVCISIEGYSQVTSFLNNQRFQLPDFAILVVGGSVGVIFISESLIRMVWYPAFSRISPAIPDAPPFPASTPIFNRPIFWCVVEISDQ